MSWLGVVHPSWGPIFRTHLTLINRIESQIAKEEICPTKTEVFRAFQVPLEKMKVVVFGQDPYPTPSHACGYAFSVQPSVRPLPKSLKNIFQELRTDLGGNLRTNGDLSDWVSQGVGLINRVLTVPSGESGGHSNIGWQKLTNDVAIALSKQGTIAILWGNYARELENIFPEESRIVSAHPSPLSAYRGFFGSRPFSKANQLLLSRGKAAIDWL